MTLDHQEKATSKFLPIAVIGAGAVGNWICATLKSSGLKSTILFDRFGVAPSQPSRLSETLLGKEEGHAPVGGPYELVFLCVKSYQIQEALREWRSIFQKDQVVIVVANGAIDELLSAESSLLLRRGVCFVGIRPHSENQWLVSQGNPPHLVWGGGRLTEAEAVVKEACGSWLHVDDIAAWAHSKWLYNTVINSFVAANGLRLNGEALAYEGELRQLFAESWELGRLLWGEWQEPRPSFEKLWQLLEATRTNENSMARDLRLGRKTEVEVLSGLIHHPNIETAKFPLLAKLDRALKMTHLHPG